MSNHSDLDHDPSPDQGGEAAPGTPATDGACSRKVPGSGEPAADANLPQGSGPLRENPAGEAVKPEDDGHPAGDGEFHCAGI
jgi:hypothetical protein